MCCVQCLTAFSMAVCALVGASVNQHFFLADSGASRRLSGLPPPPSLCSITRLCISSIQRMTPIAYLKSAGNQSRCWVQHPPTAAAATLQSSPIRNRPQLRITRILHGCHRKQKAEHSPGGGGNGASGDRRIGEICGRRKHLCQEMRRLTIRLTRGALLRDSAHTQTFLPFLVTPFSKHKKSSVREEASAPTPATGPSTTAPGYSRGPHTDSLSSLK